MPKHVCGEVCSFFVVVVFREILERVNALVVDDFLFLEPCFHLE